MYCRPACLPASLSPLRTDGMHARKKYCRPSQLASIQRPSCGAREPLSLAGWALSSFRFFPCSCSCSCSFCADMPPWPETPTLDGNNGTPREVPSDCFQFGSTLSFGSPSGFSPTKEHEASASSCLSGNPECGQKRPAARWVFLFSWFKTRHALSLPDYFSTLLCDYYICC